MSKADKADVAFEQLEDSEGERFVPVEARPTSARIKTRPTDLALRARKREQETRNNVKALNGRHCVWLVFDYCRANSNMFWRLLLSWLPFLRGAHLQKINSECLH